jgi:hypothetical protein
MRYSQRKLVYHDTSGVEVRELICRRSVIKALYGRWNRSAEDITLSLVSSGNPQGFPKDSLETQGLSKDFPRTPQGLFGDSEDIPRTFQGPREDFLEIP